MPFTPYHFGPSGFFGLLFRKYIDLPVFLLTNVVVDIEVVVINLLGLGWPIHRYIHTLLIGALAGAIWGVAAYPFRNFFEKIMRLIRLPYKATLPKMIISGVLGIWLHVIFDAVFHWDVQLFWPSRTRPLWHLFNERQIKAICLAFFIAAIVLYTITAYHTKKQKNIT
jgi:membrane-bound metal-dependent hydrolase YbcI (DUF457 family)